MPPVEIGCLDLEMFGRVVIADLACLLAIFGDEILPEVAGL